MDSETTLRIERELSAPPEIVYDAWVNPEVFVKWWGPEGMTTPIHNLDVREGGSWSATMENSDGIRHASSGVYKVLDPPRRIVFTWAWDNENEGRSHETEIEVTFSKTGSGTKMVFVQQTFESKSARDNHQFGWSSSFNDLAKVLA